jgi:hypothetical protein
VCFRGLAELETLGGNFFYPGFLARTCWTHLLISKDEKSRMAYEAREAEIHDQMTRVKIAREEASDERAIKIAEKMIKRGDTIEDIVDITELSQNKIIELRKKYLQ